MPDSNGEFILKSEPDCGAARVMWVHNSFTSLSGLDHSNKSHVLSLNAGMTIIFQYFMVTPEFWNGY